MHSVRIRQASLAVVAALAASLATAQSLQPFQQAALDQILATVDPEVRPMMRAQLAPTLAVLNREQIAMMLAGMASDGEDEAFVEEPAYEESVASPEDLAYNRAQFEPVIRRAWQAEKAFDDFVDAKLAEHCGTNHDEFAAFGSGWRYELYPLAPTWQRASNSADLDVQIIGAPYAPQDGRYDFDFSDVKLDFDETATERAIADACARYRAIGAEFVAAARTGSDDPPENGMQLEGAANGKVGPLRDALEQTLQSQAPAGNGAVFTALLNGRRVE